MHPQHFMCRVSLKAPMERAKGQAAKFKVRKSWVSCHLQNLILFYFGDSRQELAWLLRISQLHLVASWLYESWMNIAFAFAGAVANCLLIAAGHKFRLGKNPLRATRFDLKYTATLWAQNLLKLTNSPLLVVNSHSSSKEKYQIFKSTSWQIDSDYENMHKMMNSSTTLQ